MIPFFKHILLSAILSGAIYNAGAQKLPKIEFEKYTLKNGLQVILSVNKKLPAVNVNLWYHVGSKNENPGKTGFAHLFEHMMFQGSKHVVGEYLQLAEQAGANLRTGGVNGTTSEDRTNYFETVPTGSLEYALWLESDRMGFLTDALTQEKLSNQQDVVKNEKRQGDNSPYSMVQYLIADNLYPAGHPYAHTVIGSMDDLTAASQDDVKEFFKTWYAPNNCTLTLSGDFDPEQAKALIQKYFGPLPSGDALSRPGINIPALGRTKQVFAKDRVPQGRLYLVYPVPQMFSPEEAPLDVAAEILGQGQTSCLYKKLVRELELASDVRVSNSTSEISGEFQIVITARPGKSLDEIRKVVDGEIVVFNKTGATREELERSKARSEMHFLSGLERIGGFGGIADRLGQYNTFLGNPDYFQQDYDRYQQVTATEILSSFDRWIAHANRLEIYITPETAGRPDAQEFDRTVVPSTAATVMFHGPKVSKKTLSNGLEIVVSERHELPIVNANLIIKSENLLETMDKAGESSMTAGMMDKGTRKRTTLEIREQVEKLGSSIGVSGGKTGANATLTSLKKHLDATFDIFSDVILNPTFPADEMEREKKQTIDRLARQKSRPESVASELFNKLLFGATHPLGISSTETSVKNLTVQDLVSNYKTYWVPNNAILAFVGDITLDEATKLAEKYLGVWKTGNVPTRKMPEYQQPSNHTIYLVDRQAAPQSQIRIGSVAPDRYTKDYYPLLVMNTLMGGGFASRLNLNLREDKGYTYGAFSAVNYGRDYGSWAASAGVQTKFTKESLVEFKKEISGMSGSRPVTNDELDGVKKNLTRGYVQNFESVGMVLGQIAPLLTYELPVDEIDNYIPSVEKQTPSSVTGMAKKYIDFDHAITVVVGDLSKIEEPIRALGWGKVVVVDEDGKVLR